MIRFGLGLRLALFVEAEREIVLLAFCWVAENVVGADDGVVNLVGVLKNVRVIFFGESFELGFYLRL